jgi:hypothetical protein
LEFGPVISTKAHFMELLLNEIDLAAQAGLWIIAIHGALAVPDICGALAEQDGLAKKSRYIAWFEENLPRYGSGKEFYFFRCSLLHQGTTSHPEGLDRVIFACARQQVKLHCVGINGCLVMDAPDFCSDVTAAARKWLSLKANDHVVSMNLERSIQMHPFGIPRVVAGLPVLA